MKATYDPLHPSLTEIARLIGALKIDEFPTMRAARLAGELLEELKRIAASESNRKEPGS